jgi:hypothetical protein
MLMQEEIREVTEVEDKLNNIVKVYGDDNCSLDLLMFLGKHPHTRFSRMAIAHSIDAQRLNIDRPLKQLLTDGLIRMYVENGLTVYALTEDASLCGLVTQLVSLDWYKWQTMLKRCNN